MLFRPYYFLSGEDDEEPHSHFPSDRFRAKQQEIKSYKSATKKPNRKPLNKANNACTNPPLNVGSGMCNAIIIGGNP